MKMIVSYVGNETNAHLSGNLVAQFDINYSSKEERLPFTAFFDSELLYIDVHEEAMVYDKRRLFHCTLIQRSNSIWRTEYLWLFSINKYQKYWYLQ